MAQPSMLFRRSARLGFYGLPPSGDPDFPRLLYVTFRRNGQRPVGCGAHQPLVGRLLTSCFLKHLP